MIEFSKKELKLISNKCGDEYIQRYKGIEKREKDKIVKVVNTGMVSSGKSSLFNILVDYIDEEHFPTGAARTTTMADYFDYKDISFIDTPGIDVRSEDDALAFRTIMEADLIMMVHNIKTGPVNRSEAEWLEKIVGRMKDPEMCKARLLFVCTWKDTRERDEDYHDIIADVKNQVFEIAGTEIPFFAVSAKKYADGVNKGKEKLKNSSGILELKQYLEEYAAEYIEKKSEMNEAEMNVLLSEIRKQLVVERSFCYDQIRKISDKVQSKYKARTITWEKIHELFSLKKNQLTTLENEYEEEFRGVFLRLRNFLEK